MTEHSYCQAEIRPSWANRAVTCGSRIVNGKCAKYAHKADGTEPRLVEVEVAELERLQAMEQRAITIAERNDQDAPAANHILGRDEP
jgi:hypothetical protein